MPANFDCFVPVVWDGLLLILASIDAMREMVSLRYSSVDSPGPLLTLLLSHWGYWFWVGVKVCYCQRCCGVF